MSGPGTELKTILANLGIVAAPHCKCSRRAALMDKYGPEWCERNIETILGWLKEEADRRKMPFVRVAALALIKLAIRNARKSLRS